MLERLRSIGGVLRIDSAPFRRTKVRAEAPVIQTTAESTWIEFDKSVEQHPKVPAA
jgi:hypothetical protein